MGCAGISRLRLGCRICDGGLVSLRAAGLQRVVRLPFKVSANLGGESLPTIPQRPELERARSASVARNPGCCQTRTQDGVKSLGPVRLAGRFIFSVSAAGALVGGVGEVLADH